MTRKKHLPEGSLLQPASCTLCTLLLKVAQQTSLMPLKRLQHLHGHAEWQTCSVFICIDVCNEHINVVDLADRVETQTYLNRTSPEVW